MKRSEGSDYDDYSISTKEEVLKFEDFSSQIIKKEEADDDQDFELHQHLDHAEHIDQRFNQLLYSLEEYLHNFVSVEDFSVEARLMNDKDTQSLISEAKDHFEEWGMKIIHSLGENLRKKGVQHFLPDSHLVQFIETTKRRIFNSYKQLKKNLTEALMKVSRDVDQVHTTELPSRPVKRIIKKKSDFPQKARNLLKSWFVAHAQDPYPSHEEKIQLAREGGISMKQLENWLTNTRGRIWKKMQQETKFGLEIENTLLNNEEELL